MHLNPYGEYAVLLAASLANEWPADCAGIEERAREFGMTGRFVIRSDDHARTRAMIDDWLRMVDATTEDERAALLNRTISEVAAYPRLTNHDDEGWHLHYRDSDQSLSHVLTAVISVGTALHLTTRGMHRIGRCAAGRPGEGDCEMVIVDVSRNGTQKYCSVRCANRAAVRRHRARTASVG
ncbi:MAG: CGNR zinc finger domain-containing protein [Gordonia paraffinivorans]